MPKALAILGLVISLCLLLLFGLDLAMGIPFNKVNQSMDIGFVIASAMMVYLSWTTLRALR